MTGHMNVDPRPTPPLSPIILIPANLLFLAVPLAYFLIPAIRVRMAEQNTWPFERSTVSGRACVRLAHSSMLVCFLMILFVDWLTYVDTRTTFRNFGFAVLAPLMLLSVLLMALTTLFAWPRWALYSKFRDDRGLVQEGVHWLRDRRRW